MDDAWPAHPADTDKARTAMREEGIDERTRRVAGGRMHHHPRGFVDDDQIGILEQDLERDRLGGRGRLLDLRNEYDKILAVIHALRRVAQALVRIWVRVRDPAGEDELLQTGARQLRQLALQGPIEAQPGLLAADADNYAA